MKDLPKIIRSVLAERTPAAVDDRDGTYRRSAVLIPLFEAKGEFRLLFTKRTTKVEAHKGQISFPGGRTDRGDKSPEETALREAEEEIGLRREDVTMLGRIDDAVTLTSNYIVHPFVGLIPHPYYFRINPGEVDRILEVPLEIFLPEKGVGKVLPIQYEGHIMQSWGFRSKSILGLPGIML
jgi:8-oxo-dGTP pyrophosphatase MutT (NUDIX family)